MVANVNIQRPMQAQTNPTRRYIDVLSVLTERHIKARYRGSSLGVFWSLLNPLIMTGVYTAVFGHTFARYYDNSVITYLLAVFIGLVVMNFFSMSTVQALLSVVSNASLINKIRLPISVYPMSFMAASCFQLLVGAAPLLLLIAAFTSRNMANVLLLLIPLTALILVSVGAALGASLLYVFYRDIPHLYELLVFVFWVATPVFYPLSIVPARYRPFIEWNPLSQIIESIRSLALLNRVPSVLHLLVPLALGIVVAFLGWIAFRASSRRFMDYL